MSWHRNVRSMRCSDEYDGYDDDDFYGHSVEEDYTMSPAPSDATFMYDRSLQPQVSSFLPDDSSIAEECETFEEDDASPQVPTKAVDQGGLNESERAKLMTCLDDVRSVLGETVPESKLIDAIIAVNFDTEKALDNLLSAAVQREHVTGGSLVSWDSAGVASTSVGQAQVRLSGAQRRKLARDKAAKLGVPLIPRKRKPRRKGVGEAAGEIGPTPHGIKKGLRIPGISTPKPGLGVGTPRKRTGTLGSTTSSVEQAKAVERPKGASGIPSGASTIGRGTGVVKNALTSTKMVIVHGNYPEDRLSEEEGRKVQAAVCQGVFKCPMGKGPRFTNSYVSNGVVFITCADGEAKIWLEAYVGGMKPWEGANLKVGPARTMVQTTKAVVWVPIDAVGSSDPRGLIPLFQTQNRELSTAGWHLISSTVDPKGTTLVLGIDQTSLEWLRANNFQLHFGLRRVTFTVPGGDTSDAAGTSSKPAAQ